MYITAIMTKERTPQCRPMAGGGGVHWSPLTLLNGDVQVTRDVELLASPFLHPSNIYIKIGKVNASLPIIFIASHGVYENLYRLLRSHMCYIYLRAICLMGQVYDINYTLQLIQ